MSLFWKTYGLGLPVTACLTELVVLLVGVVYLAVRSTLVSYEFVDPSKAGRRLRALAVVAISAVVAVANARPQLEYLRRPVHRPAGRPLPGGAGGDLPGLRGAALPGLFRPGPGQQRRAKAAGTADGGRGRVTAKHPGLPEDFRPTAAGVLWFRGGRAQGPSISAAKASSWACKLAPWSP